MTQAQVITLYQPTLQSIALNILGSISDAEDAVQDAFLKWLTIDTSKIENTKAYLIRMVTNSCLNILNNEKKQHKGSIEDYQEVLEDHGKEHSLYHFDHENQLKEAWSILHRKLEPVERAVYVLREVFSIEYEDLQFMVDRKADNCRKILSRAKQKLQQAELPKLKVSLPELHLMDHFKRASRLGELSVLVHGLSIDFLKKNK